MLGEQLVAEVDRQQLAAEAASMQVWPPQPVRIFCIQRHVHTIERGLRGEFVATKCCTTAGGLSTASLGGREVIPAKTLHPEL